MPDSSPHLASALEAYRAGISTLPPAQDGSKRPGIGAWAEYQHNRASEDLILSWYGNGRTGVGWVCGAVSGNLEVIDFDDRSIWSEYQRLAKESGLGGLLDRVVAGYLEHSPNGAHLAYRCPQIAGNTKLAQGKDRKTLIETRGEGGFIIVAPSSGSVNARGAYVLQSGGPATIASIRPDERQALHDLARAFDETIKPVESYVHKSQADGGRPGDDYNARSSWSEVLEPAGWVKVYSRLGVASWRRPGKTHGISATTNHADSDLLYVFSSSTCFEQERGYSKFSTYAILYHNGDFKEAARELSLKGYGLRIEEPVETIGVDLSGILSRYDKKEERKRPSLSELLRVPGLVGELAEWINESSYKPQPILALGAAIAAMGTVLGRKVQAPTRLRTNVYCLGIGLTGCGKDRARHAIRDLFSAIDCENMIGESFASDSAVETAISDNPVCLYLVDELGHFLGNVKNTNAPTHMKAIIPTLMSLYGASHGSYRRKTYADPERNKDNLISQPCLSLYATTVPSNLYGAITKENASDGFLSRLLVFESDDPDPWPVICNHESYNVPQRLIDGFRHWANAPINPEATGDIEKRMRPDPYRIPITPEARSVIDGLESYLMALRAKIRKQGDEQGPYTRISANAIKLAMIRACGIRLDNPEITEADAQWGCDLALELTERFLAKIGCQVAENKIESATQRVLEIVRSAGEIAHNSLTRKTQWLSRAQRLDVIASLAEAGSLDVDKTGKATIYRAARRA